jgi:hypothetical protein
MRDLIKGLAEVEIYGISLPYNNNNSKVKLSFRSEKGKYVHLQRIQQILECLTWEKKHINLEEVNEQK